MRFLENYKENKEIWANPWVDRERNAIELYIVKKALMEQQVVADAKALLSYIQTKEIASVYGIYFDFDKADIKPQSEPAIKEIAKLLQENPRLKLYIVGHTDNVGKLDYNLKLSKARTDAMVKELTIKYKVFEELSYID